MHSAGYENCGNHGYRIYIFDIGASNKCDPRTWMKMCSIFWVLAHPEKLCANWKGVPKKRLQYLRLLISTRKLKTWIEKNQMDSLYRDRQKERFTQPEDNS